MSNIKFILGLVVGLLLLGCIGYIETHHTQVGHIVSVNQSNNNVLIEDNMGDLWIINDKSFNIGDDVKITFNNQATTTKEDDEITSVKKI